MFLRLSKKFLHSGCVAKRFRTATAGGGECSAPVSVGQARREIRPSEKLVEEPGVEAVTCANRIDDHYRHGGCAESRPFRIARAPLAPILTTMVSTICANRESAVSKSSARDIFIASRSFGSRIST